MDISISAESDGGLEEVRYEGRLLYLIDKEKNRFFPNGDRMVQIGSQNGAPIWGAEDCLHAKGTG